MGIFTDPETSKGSKAKHHPHYPLLLCFSFTPYLQAGRSRWTKLSWSRPSFSRFLSFSPCGCCHGWRTSCLSHPTGRPLSSLCSPHGGWWSPGSSKHRGHSLGPDVATAGALFTNFPL